MLQLTTLLLAAVPLSQALEVTLYASSLDGQQSQTLGTLDYDESNDSLTALNSADAAQIPLDGTPYCIGTHSADSALEHSCFSLLELEWPLHYRLELAGTKGPGNSKFSLVRDESQEGLGGLVVDTAVAPVGSAIPLKKTTKTYADMRKDSEGGVEQFSASSAEKSNDEEKDGAQEGGPIGYLKNNWKQLLVGLIIYNVVTGFVKPGEEARGEESKEKK